MFDTTRLLNQFYMVSFKTDFGWMRAISDGSSLIRLDWNQTGWQEPDRPDHVSRETKSQLHAYLNGHLQQFILPLAPAGKNTTGQYWLNVLAEVPYGALISYTEFANLAGKPKGARAAGSICASNPIPIIYPCHRIIHKDGTLGNYGGGSDQHPAHPDNLVRKTALIRLECF